MAGAWRIARWEVVRNLRNRQFLLGLVATPMLILIGGVLFGMVPGWFERRTGEPALYLVLDRVGAPAGWIEGAQDDRVAFTVWEGDAARLADAVRERGARGYVILDERLLRGEPVPIAVQAERGAELRAVGALLTDLALHLRAGEAGIEAADLQRLLAPVPWVVIPIGAADLGRERRIAGLAMAGVLLLLIMNSGTMLLMSALQERRDRMAEVILSSVDAGDLMQGKVIGQFVLGLVQLAVLVGLGLPILIVVIDVPFPVAAVASEAPWLLFALFLCLGYLLYASLYVGLGATMLEDLTSAGQIPGLIMLLPLSSLAILSPVMNDPDGLAARLGTLMPITSPFIVFVRAGYGAIPTWELALSAAVLFVSALVLTRAAARVFRVGTLMYGKQATPAEIWRWARHG